MSSNNFIRIGIRVGFDDSFAIALSSQALDFLGIRTEKVRSSKVFFLPEKLNHDLRKRAVNILHDEVLEMDQSDVHFPEESIRVMIRKKPGVTDNEGSTAKEILAELLELNWSPHQKVHCAREFSFLDSTVEEVQRIASELLFNPLIEECHVLTGNKKLPAVPEPESGFQPLVEKENIEITLEELVEMGEQRMLALRKEEWQAIQNQFQKEEYLNRRQAVGLGSEPTDVELECIAQTWSEHCHHKIFNAKIEYSDDESKKSVDSLFKTYISGLTKELDKDYLVSVFHDNAGVVRYFDSYDLAFKIETHNTPSALDPYGGAMTGIVGVDRDALGTGLGSKPIAHVKGFCLGDPNTQSVPEKLLHPRRIREGVHAGVREGGNESGIPLMRGFEIFDPCYLGKPLVFCGTLGRLPAKIQNREGTVKEVYKGDLVVMMGGRVGKDGIHGATFSSVELSTNSPAQAVQIGDPITQKRMTDALMEARDRNLFRAITDNGAGGLSSSAGEMAEYSGGLKLDLAKVPLKYEGLHPWEIFLSEAQERMTLAVSPDTIDELLEFCSKRGVEASVLGEFTDSGYLHLVYGEETVAYLEMNFLHNGDPRYELKGHFEPVETEEPPINPPLASKDILLSMLCGPNLKSKEEYLRQYDHEVKALSTVKLLSGRNKNVIPDSSVLQVHPAHEDYVAMSEAVLPYYSQIDTLPMARSVVDLCFRRLLSSGADIERVAGVDNFCWPNVVREKMPRRSHKLALLVRSCEGMFEACKKLSIPLISGKDSMANDCTLVDPPISVHPTLLFSAIAPLNKDAITTNTFKKEGQLIYLLGETKEELGASEYSRVMKRQLEKPHIIGNKIPDGDVSSFLNYYRILSNLINEGHIQSCHALATGGLAWGLSLATLGSGFGFKVNLDSVHSNPNVSLFSESIGRLLFTVDSSNKEEIEASFQSYELVLLGQTLPHNEDCRIRTGNEEIILSQQELFTSYQGGLA